jgi:hypothetical protein
MITKPLCQGERVKILTARPLVGIYEGDVGRVFNVHPDNSGDVEVLKPTEQADGGTFITRATFGPEDLALIDDPPATDAKSPRA